MYTLVSAIGKNYDGSRWAAVSIGDVTLKVLYDTYKTLWAVLSNPFLDSQVAFDLSLIKEANRFSALTFNQYLASLGNLALTTQTTIPTIDTQYVRYADIWKANYTVTPIHDTAAADSPLPVSEKHHLQLTKDGLDYETFYDYCLVSVNGLYHYTDGSTTGVYVKDAMKSINLAGDNQLGMTSFKDIGKITLIPITDAMIYKQSTDQSYCHQMYLNLGVDYTSKIVMVCIGGYLHVMDSSFMKWVSDTCLLLDFDRYPLIDRYFQSKDLIDLTSLDLFVPPMAETAVEIDQLLSDAAMLALVKLSQSFIVVLDTDDFFYQRQDVIAGTIPGIHISTVEPIYPLVMELGKVVNYWPSEDDGFWALTSSNSLKHNRVYRTTKYSDLPVLSDQRRANDPVNQCPAFFQVMGKDL